MIEKAESMSETIDSMNDFIKTWEEGHVHALGELNLFQPNLTSKWTQEQKETFVKTFYHARGHFHDFLWFLGSHASDKTTKEIVLQNISEEFNGSAASHEQMYLEFAKEFGGCMKDEIIEEKFYLPFLRSFNRGHIAWLKNSDANGRFAAFAAYERLDNIDYAKLYELANSIGASRKGLIFFKVHLNARHFDTTEEYLSLIWQKNPQAVKEAFTFIGHHQMEMWQKLSDFITLRNIGDGGDQKI